MIKAPWFFPVPVQTGEFIGLSKQDQTYNVVTALSKLEEPFSFRDLNSSELLYSDAQTPYCGVVGRWGAGRSGFYKDKYLKGVGLTPLAANWKSSDFFHSSGYLPATSGIWELLISDVVESLGLSHTINPCETILLAPNSAAYKKSVKQYLLVNPNIPYSKINLHLRALTIKGSSFARPSNILWLLSQSVLEDVDGEEYSVVNFLRLLKQACDGKSDSFPEQLSLDHLVADIEASFFKALRNCELFYQNGLDWTNYHNNFSLDGRFLDLEAPVWNGNAFFGGIIERNSNQDRYAVSASGGSGTAFNFIHVFSQWQFFIHELTSRMNSLAMLYSSLNVTKTASVFEYLSGALSKKFTTDHLLRNIDAIEKWMVNLVLPSISKKSEQLLKSVIHDFCNFKFKSETPKDSLKLRIHATHDVAFSYGVNESLFAFKDFQTDLSVQMKDKAKYLNTEMQNLSNMSDLDKVLFKLSELRKVLRQP